MARAALLLGSTTACAGLLGFVLGRASVSAAIDKPSAASANVAAFDPSTAHRNAKHDTPPETVEVSRNEAFVRFVMQPKKMVDLFGDRPLKAEQSPSSVP